MEAIDIPMWGGWHIGIYPEGWVLVGMGVIAVAVVVGAAMFALMGWKTARG